MEISLPSTSAEQPPPGARLLYHCWPARRRIHATRLPNSPYALSKHGRVQRGTGRRRVWAGARDGDGMGWGAGRWMVPWAAYLCRRSHDCMCPSLASCSSCCCCCYYCCSSSCCCCAHVQRYRPEQRTVHTAGSAPAVTGRPSARATPPSLGRTVQHQRIYPNHRRQPLHNSSLLLSHPMPGGPSAAG
jgi:hypothetical protein